MALRWRGLALAGRYQKVHRDPGVVLATAPLALSTSVQGRFLQQPLRKFTETVEATWQSGALKGDLLGVSWMSACYCVDRVLS